MATLSSQLSSQLLKYLRKHPDVTQKAVADYRNLSPSFLSEIISGKKNLNNVAAMKLSQFLEKPAAVQDPTIKQFSFKGKKLSSHLEHVRFVRIRAGHRESGIRGKAKILMMDAPSTIRRMLILAWMLKRWRQRYVKYAVFVGKQFALLTNGSYNRR